MNLIIKEIRNRLNFSQEQLGEALGVSSITISRWENKKVTPSILAQKQLFELCKSRKIDLSDFIVDSVKKSNSDNLILYHASRNGLNGLITPSSRSKCDFGKGFYMGTDPLQPLTLVSNEEFPIFYTVMMNFDNLKVLTMNIDLEWALLISYYRGYMENYKDSPLYDKYKHLADDYDIIEGYIADDRMYQVLTDFFQGRITDKALISALSALKLGKQYVAITQKACDSISIISQKKLTKLELMFLSDKSKIRRIEGVSLANEVVKQHRRDGLFFDEILAGERL